MFSACVSDLITGLINGKFEIKEHMKIGVIQLTSVLEPERNLAKIREFIQLAKHQNAEALFLPEAFYSMSDGTKPTPYLVEENNHHYEAIRSLALESGMYILGGSAATNVNGKILNRSYNFSPDGSELTTYDKINLFAVDLSRHPSQTVIDEAKVYTPGRDPKILNLKNYKIGLSICFDLRFPELFRSYSFQGANVLSISSAFTVPTGKAHWHTLLRARAIENQSYVIASAQWGAHNDKIFTYGHSLVIDPWGEVLVDAQEGEKIIFSELSLDKIEAVRSRMNVIRNPKQ
jgi:predicted amidohydrolase